MLPEAEAAEALQMPSLPERTRHADGGGGGGWPFLLRSVSSGGSAWAAWHAVFSLLIQPHTGCRAPPGSGLLAWSWPPWQQGQHSICPPLGWGLPSKSRAGDLSVGTTEKERGETWSLNSGALGCPFRPGCKTPKCEPSFFQPSAGSSLISSVPPEAAP